MADLWTVGVERETSPGVYAMLKAEINGWVLWRFETVNGRYFTAGKASEGKRRPEPVGVAQALWGGAPGVLVHLSGPLHATFYGTHMHGVETDIREIGARFTTRVTVPFDPLPYDGKRLEVYVRSMPGPRSFTKLVTDEGLIDMTGLAEIIAARS